VPQSSVQASGCPLTGDALAKREGSNPGHGKDDPAKGAGCLVESVREVYRGSLAYQGSPRHAP
jgi:hypothetical protein